MQWLWCDEGELWRCFVYFDGDGLRRFLVSNDVGGIVLGGVYAIACYRYGLMVGLPTLVVDFVGDVVDASVVCAAESEGNIAGVPVVVTWCAGEGVLSGRWCVVDNDGGVVSLFLVVKGVGAVVFEIMESFGGEIEYGC